TGPRTSTRRRTTRRGATRGRRPTRRRGPRGMADVKLDSKGIEKILKSSKVQAVVHGLAEKIAAEGAANIDPDAEVAVDDYTTDRAASSVTIKDRRGRLWHVRDGVLTRAAANAGLEVTER